MIKRCVSCPQSHVLRTDLLKRLNGLNYITFNQWESTDRTTFAVHDLPVNRLLMS